MGIFSAFGNAWKKFWQKNKRGKLLVLSVFGTAIFILSGWELLSHFETGFFYDNQVPVVDQLDNVAWITLGIGGIIMIAGWLYFNDHNKSYKRYHELIDTDSKAQFVRNIDEIEELAIQLGPDFERQVIDKRKEFNVKTR